MRGGAFRSSREGPQNVGVEVQNLQKADARLYSIRDGQRISLGTVGGKQDARFTVPWNFHQSLRIEINLLSGPTCTTRTLQVQAGDILELQISSVFTQSSFCR